MKILNRSVKSEEYAYQGLERISKNNQKEDSIGNLNISQSEIAFENVKFNHFEINNRTYNISMLKDETKERKRAIEVLYKYLLWLMIGEFDWHLTDVKRETLVQAYHLCYQSETNQKDINIKFKDDSSGEFDKRIQVLYNRCYKAKKFTIYVNQDIKKMKTNQSEKEKQYLYPLSKSILSGIDKFSKAVRENSKSSCKLFEIREKKANFVWMFKADFEKQEKEELKDIYKNKKEKFYITNSKTIKNIEAEYIQSIKDKSLSDFSIERPFSIVDINKDTSITINFNDMNKFVELESKKKDYRQWKGQISYVNNSTGLCFKNYEANIFRSQLEKHKSRFDIFIDENKSESTEESIPESSEEFKDIQISKEDFNKSCMLTILRLFDIVDYNKFDSANLKKTKIKNFDIGLSCEDVTGYAESIMKKFKDSKNEKGILSYNPEIVLFAAFIEFIKNFEEKLLQIFTPEWSFFENKKISETAFVKITDKNCNEMINYVNNGLCKDVKEKYSAKLCRIQNFFITFCFAIVEDYYKRNKCKYKIVNNLFTSSNKIDFHKFISCSDPVEIYKEFSSDCFTKTFAHPKNQENNSESKLLEMINNSDEKKIAVCRILIPSSKTKGKQLLPLVHPLYLLKFKEK